MVRIVTEIDVEHGGVGALDENVFMEAECIVQEGHGFLDERPDPFREHFVAFQLLFDVNLQLREHPLVRRDQSFESGKNATRVYENTAMIKESPYGTGESLKRRT